MLFRESVTTAIYVKCHLLARHMNGCPLLQVFSALSVCVWVSPRLQLKDWMMEVHTGVCVSTVNQGERGVGKKKKSIDPRLHSDHLPLPSNGLTPWPPKVCRQLSRIACRQTVCQRQALLHKFLSFFFLFSNPILAKWSYAASLQKRENKKLLCPLTNCLRGSDGGYTLVKKKQNKVSLVARKLTRPTRPVEGRPGDRRGGKARPVAINPRPSWRSVVCLLALCSSSDSCRSLLLVAADTLILAGRQRQSLQELHYFGGLRHKGGHKKMLRDGFPTPFSGRSPPAWA